MATKFVFFFCFTLAVFQSWAVATKKQETLTLTGSKIAQLTLTPSKKWDLKGRAKMNQENDNTFVSAEENTKLKIKTSAQKIIITADEISQLDISQFSSMHLEIAVQKGNILIRNSQGVFKINLDEGKLQFQNNSGRLLAHSYSAPLEILEFKGSAEIRSHLAALRVLKSNGDFKVVSFASPLFFENSEGRLDFRTTKSNTRLKNFKGHAQGFSNKGNITGSWTPKKAQLETKSGNIRLYFSKSKARVTAQSWEGKVYAPRNFYKDRAGGIYNATGRIQDRGDFEGTAALKSRSGTISIL